MAELPPLGWFELSLAAALQLGVAGLSGALGLGLGKRLLVATARMLLQLLLVGQLLSLVFDVDRPPLLLALAVAMCALAAHAAVTRSERRWRGGLVSTFGTLLLTTGSTLTIATFAVLRLEDPWKGQYLVPLLGMLLGNSLTGVSLCLRRLIDAFEEDRARLEMALCLGATRWEAARAPFAQALRLALVPTLNTMTVAGVVSLPGMMTGQILAGVSPLVAVRYQALIFILISFCTAASSGLVALAVFRHYLDSEHRLRVRR